MTSSQRKTLFIELCEKLPYKVKVFADNMPSDESVCELVKTDGKNADLFVNKKTYNVSLDHIKPYLRSVSKMTEKETKQYGKLTYIIQEFKDSNGYFSMPDYTTLDWLNKHFFDCRGLIEKGLALEAPDNMYEME